MVQNLRSVNFFYKDGSQVVTKELPRNLLKTIIIGFYNPDKKGSQPTATKRTNIDSAKIGLTDAEINLDKQPSHIENTLPAVKQSELASPDINTTSSSVSDSTIADLGIKSSPDNVIAPDSVTFSRSSRWYFGFRGGYANRLFRTGNQLSPATTKYLKELKSGYAIGAGAGYFFWKNVALALNTEFYKSNATMSDDSRDDAISIRYIGSSLVHRKVSQNQKSAVYTGFTVGYQSYSNQAHEIGNALTTKGKAVGWGANVSLDYKISPRAAISFTASCIMGTIYKMTRVTGGKKEIIQLAKKDFEELSRIALTVGLRFF